MMSVTRCTLVTMSVIVVPASVTRREPDSTRSTLVAISDLISLAASALRCASERTSPATTAKPRPCSPARAASTAAFSARMLVWKAIPSITPMMSAMRRELSLISPIVVTTCPITEPPRCAVSAAELASWLAVSAASAVCRTVPVSCVSEAAACCRLDAVCSVRADRSMLPLAISALAVPMLSVEPRTSPISRSNEPCIASSARSSCAVSSLPRVSMRPVRSKRAIASATSAAWPSGRVIERVSHTASAPPAASATSPNTTSAIRARSLVAASAWIAWSSWSRCCCATARMPSR